MQMTNTCMKRCFTSYVIRKMQIKITLRYHYTSVRMAIIILEINKVSSYENTGYDGWVERQTPALIQP